MNPISIISKPKQNDNYENEKLENIWSFID